MAETKGSALRAGHVEAALAKLEQGEQSLRRGVRIQAFTGWGRLPVAVYKDWDPFRLGEALNYHLKPDPLRL